MDDKISKQGCEISTENEEGASLVEYAVLAALIVVLAIAAIQLLGRSVSKQFSIVSDAIS